MSYTWPPCWPSASRRADRPRESARGWSLPLFAHPAPGPVPRPISTVIAENGTCPSSVSCRDRPFRPNSTVSKLPEAYAMRLDFAARTAHVYDRDHRRARHPHPCPARGPEPRLSGRHDPARGRQGHRRPSWWPRSATSPASDSAKKSAGRAGLLPAPRVRRGGPPSGDHQAGLTAGALGGHRGRGQLPGQGRRETLRRCTNASPARRPVQARVAVARKS